MNELQPFENEDIIKTKGNTRNGSLKKFEMNQVKIEECYVKFLKEHGRAPLKVELAQLTGLARSTILEHIAKVTLNDFRPKHKLLLDRILTMLGQKAMDGNLTAAKLFLNVVGEWSEKTVVELNENETKTLRIEFLGADVPTMEIPRKTIQDAEIVEENISDDNTFNIDIPGEEDE